MARCSVRVTRWTRWWLAGVAGWASSGLAAPFAVDHLVTRAAVVEAITAPGWQHEVVVRGCGSR